MLLLGLSLLVMWLWLLFVYFCSGCCVMYVFLVVVVANIVIDVVELVLFASISLLWVRKYR